MRDICCVGGGPAGLYSAILCKLRDPSLSVVVVERDAAATTYGWGIVYWDDLLADMYRCDEPTAAAVRAASVGWSGQEMRVEDRAPVHLGGHGYAISRRGLLDIFHRRALEIGVDVRLEHAVTDAAEVQHADLVVVADGVHSRLRDGRADRFGTTRTVGGNRYIWLGTTQEFRTFTFAFERTGAGWIWFHAYQYGASASTVIVECTERTWSALGFPTMSDRESVEVLAGIFGRHLGGHGLSSGPDAVSRNHWTRFTHLSNASWHDAAMVLVGDAAHTTHFSVGSGTKLALMDAMALAATIVPDGAEAPLAARDLPAALGEYERQRRPDVEERQRHARNSALWFEQVEHHLAGEPVDVGYSLRLRRMPAPAAAGPARRLSWRYWLHRATQQTAFRTARSRIGALRRARRAAGRGHLPAGSVRPPRRRVR